MDELDEPGWSGRPKPTRPLPAPTIEPDGRPTERHVNRRDLIPVKDDKGWMR
jgi:hypothetical protein